VAAGGAPDTTALTASNVLFKFDDWMKEMDEAEVPQEGRFLYVTPTVFTALKNADPITRALTVTANNGRIDRSVASLDDVTVVKVPSARMKTVYDFSNGFAPGSTAKQINAILAHPKSVIAVDKHAYIKLWPEGTHTQGDGWLYQNRKYGDLFVIPNRKAGIVINRAA
jgi:hypothetical protein